MNEGQIEQIRVCDRCNGTRQIALPQPVIAPGIVDCVLRTRPCPVCCPIDHQSCIEIMPKDEVCGVLTTNGQNVDNITIETGDVDRHIMKLVDNAERLALKAVGSTQPLRSTTTFNAIRIAVTEELAQLRTRIDGLEAQRDELLEEVTELRYHCDTSMSKYASEDAARVDALIAKIKGSES